MYHQLINPGTDPEKQFVTVKNDYATAALTAGQIVAWSVDGVGVTMPATATLPNIAGVVVDTIAVAGIGQVQRYGYNAACLVKCPTGGIAIGDQLVATNGQFYASKAVATTSGLIHDANPAFIIAGQANTTSAAAAARKVFLRC